MTTIEDLRAAARELYPEHPPHDEAIDEAWRQLRGRDIPNRYEDLEDDDVWQVAERAVELCADEDEELQNERENLF